MSNVSPRGRDPGGATYLVTTGDDGRPHLSHVAVSFQGASVRMGGGRTTRANAAARPGVALLWPPATVGDYSLIADGEATVDGDDVVVVPTRGVLRPSRTGTGWFRRQLCQRLRPAHVSRRYTLTA